MGPPEIRVPQQVSYGHIDTVFSYRGRSGYLYGHTVSTLLCEMGWIHASTGARPMEW